ncbi:MAG: HD domain-containing protein [Acidimicrobiaceae bacterium]|nr:HD domain-containing protein [Acidimicrobiaceae bacterium]
MKEGPRIEHPHSLLNVATGSSTFVEGTDLGLLLLDANGLIIDVNPTAMAQASLSREEFLGRTMTELGLMLIHLEGSPFRTEDLPSIHAMRDGVNLNHGIFGSELPGRALRWIDVSSRLVNVGAEQRTVLVTWNDVTDEVARGQILEVGSRVISFARTADTIEQTLQGLCDLLVEKATFPLVWIGVLDEHEAGRVAIEHAAGRTDYSYGGIVSSSDDHAIGRGPTGRALRTMETQIINDLSLDENFTPWRERAREFNLWSMTSIPLLTTPARVLTVYAEHTEVFEPRVVDGLVEMGQIVVNDLSLRESLRQTVSAFEGTLAALTQITDVRDPYTQGHQSRVGTLAGEIALCLGLDPELIRLIRLAGGVHDVGKISVPAEILNKPGRLTTIEYEMVQTHPQVGWNILSKASLPWPIPEVALAHHERLDGSGYPFGLSGDAIILPARIVAVADVMEAMGNRRPYRPALGIDDALAEIVAGRGTRYDASVVDACVAAFEEGFQFLGEEPLQSTVRLGSRALEVSTVSHG